MEDEERTPSLKLDDDEEAPEEDPVSANPDQNPPSPAAPAAATPNAEENEDDEEEAKADGEEEEALEEGKKKTNNNKKRKPDGEGSGSKKPKKRNVWSKSTTRKSGKKGSNKSGSQLQPDNSVYLTPIIPKIEDAPDLPVLLSKLQKAEKVELGADQLSASSVKGYRMVRATRGVVEGAWFFEITVEHLGKTGHSRLGWCTQKGDVQAPVGYDIHGYAYRDLEGSKYHAALREPYGEPFVEGDTIGFYISLPDGAALAPKPLEVVNYKGAPYVPETKEEPLKPVPGSQIAFFRNGKFQGVAFSEINAGRYYPAASMYTLPNEPPCTVRFNFGPEFRFFPSDWSGLVPAEPMCNAPFADGQVMDATAAAGGSSRAAPVETPAAPATNIKPETSPEQANEEGGAKSSTKKPVKGSASKPPKPVLKKSVKKGGIPSPSPVLQLAVEVPIESADAIVSQPDELRRIAQEASFTS